MTETTLNGLLNHRVMVEQPKHGFRIAIDTVLLAASIPALAGQKVLDIGCGVGGAMLCLACSVPDIFVTGIEIQDELAELCRRNIIRNALADQAQVIRGDIKDFIGASAFDHVMMNPPFHDEARHDVSNNTTKRMANSSHGGDLSIWITKAAAALKSGGMMTLIHRADRLDEILQESSRHFGALEILPIVPKKDAAPKRVIIRAHTGNAHSVTRSHPLVLHNDDGGYTDEAEAILRKAEAITYLRP